MHRRRSLTHGLAILGLLLVPHVAVFAQARFSITQGSFSEVKMYTTRGQDASLQSVRLSFGEESLAIRGLKCDCQGTIRIPYRMIVQGLYQPSKHRRGLAALALPPVILFSETKHGFIVVHSPMRGGPQERIRFQLDKRIAATFMDAFERATGLRVGLTLPT